MNREEKANTLFNQIHEGTYLPKDPELQTIMKNYIYGEVYHHGSLNLKTRELILIVVNTVNQTLSALKRHVLSGLKSGLTLTEIKEAVYQCTPYIGLGKVEEALNIINSVFEAQNISLPLAPMGTVNESTRFEKGFEAQSTIFSKEAIQSNHDHAPVELKHIQNYLSEYCFGDFYTRDGIVLHVREMLTFVIIATLGGCENQLRAHVNGNLNMKNNRELLLEVITQCQPYIGFPRTLNAIAIINEVATNR